MRRFRLSPGARLDLLSIRMHLEAENPTASVRYRGLFLEAFQLLAQYPLAGRERTDLESPGVRSWPVRPYVILYEPGRNRIDILRVVHGARDLPNLPLHDPGDED